MCISKNLSLLKPRPARFRNEAFVPVDGQLGGFLDSDLTIDRDGDA